MSRTTAFLQDCMCAQRRLRSALIIVLAEHSLGSRGSKASSGRQQSLWSACADYHHRISCVFAGRTYNPIGNAVPRLILILFMIKTIYKSWIAIISTAITYKGKCKQFYVIFCFKGPPESNCWFSFAPAFQLFCAVESSSMFHLCN